MSGACIHVVCTCGIECLRDLHCYSAGLPVLPLEGYGVKKPCQACQKMISLCLRGCGTEKHNNTQIDAAASAVSMILMVLFQHTV